MIDSIIFFILQIISLCILTKNWKPFKSKYFAFIYIVMLLTLSLFINKVAAADIGIIIYIGLFALSIVEYKTFNSNLSFFFGLLLFQTLVVIVGIFILEMLSYPIFSSVFLSRPVIIGLFLLLMSLLFRISPNSYKVLFQLSKKAGLPGCYIACIMMVLSQALLHKDFSFFQGNIFFLPINLLAIGCVIIILYYVYQKEYSEYLDVRLVHTRGYFSELEGAYEEIQKYTEEINLAINTNTFVSTVHIKPIGLKQQYLNLLQSIEDSILKAMLMNKLDTLIEKDIQLKIAIEDTVPPINMKDIDKARIFGIILDNAIEATTLSDKRTIIFEATTNSSLIVLSFRNTYFEKINMLKIWEYGYSTKGVGRGVGLFSVERILEGYPKLQLKTSVNEALFTQSFIITL